MMEYKKDMFIDSEYDIIEMLKIYIFKGPLNAHTMVTFMKRYILTFIFSILLNASTMSGIVSFNVPDISCFFVVWFFLLMYIDFNANTIMLRDVLLVSTHILGFNAVKHETVAMVINRFKISDGGGNSEDTKRLFYLQFIKCLKNRKKLLMDSMKLSYLESAVTVVLSYYYVLSKLTFNSFSLSVLNLSVLGMICTTIASIHHNKCIDKLEDIIKASRKAKVKDLFTDYGAISTDDNDALQLLKDSASPLQLEGDITMLRVSLFGIPVSDAFFFNIFVIAFTSFARLVPPQHHHQNLLH